MFLNPWIIGLYVGLLGMMLLYGYALTISVQIVRRWDIQSMAEGQLILERKSHLASTIVQYGLGIQVLSLILFYMTLESMAEVIPGAMCATGALKANGYGFPALLVKVAVAFVCGVWVTIHHIDTKLEDYGLTRFKYKCLFVLAPLLLCDLVLQFLYFLNLDPNVITSCCGVVFEIEGEGFGSSVASLPPISMMVIFFTSVPILLSSGYFLSRRKGFLGYYLYSSFGFILFIFSILAIISFIAPYIYEMPALHSPFSMMEKEYYYVGYILYASLFAASFLSMVPGLIEPLKRKGRNIQDAVEVFQRRALQVSIILWSFFFVASSLPILLFEIRSEGGHLFA
ncbi:MAG: hypothetical protein QGG48_10120 [Desulfatiglandales bacterium]|jgi:hypothetical protein|nr:hypothetical protein [Desulfatiglandales bacterium]